MCVAAIAWKAHPSWKLLAIGNRDEFHARPAAPLALWDNDGVMAGRDLQAGGTWLGVADGRFGLVTNLRVPGFPKPGMTSRGDLVSGWLQGRAPAKTEGMNPFNLWLADRNSLRFETNHPAAQTVELAPGIHGLSNGARGDRWFKIQRLEAALEQWLKSDDHPESLLTALADPTPQSADPEDAFSSVFIHNETYGTRCSTVVLVDAEGTGSITERRFDADGAETGRTTLPFRY